MVILTDHILFRIFQPSACTLKPVYLQPIDSETYNRTIAFFENILKLLHPFMPFITEELWHDELFGKRAILDSCIVAQLPVNGEINSHVLADVENVKQVITQIRNIRNNKQISPKETLSLSVKTSSGVDYLAYNTILTKLANLSELTLVNDKLSGASAFLVSTDEFFVPLIENIDPVAEKERLEKERDYLLGFLKSVDAKLSNERFMANAKPEIIEVEQKKKADAVAKLKIINEGLAELAN